MYPGSSNNNSNQLAGSVDGGDAHSQQATPPLVFTTQFTGSPRVHENSPSMEPLQMANYNTVLGGYDFNLNSPVIPRRQSSTQLHVEDSPIRVTCRTRDNRRSPVFTQPVGEVLMEPGVMRGSPYGYSFSGRSSPIQASSPVGGRTTSPSFPIMQADRDPPSVGPVPSSETAGPQLHSYTGANPSSFTSAQPTSPQATTPAPAPAPAAGASQPNSPLQQQPELPASVVHRALHGRCRFVEFPANLPNAETANGAGGNTKAAKHGAAGGTAEAGQNQMALFIGQVRFETTPAELIWLVHRTSGACASHLESRGAGCYLLYCRSEADLQLVRSLHKRVLFDIGGVWLARTAEEVDALCEYVALDAPLLSRKAHLPRDSMVVEELKPDAPSHHAPGTRYGHSGANANTNANNSSHKYNAGGKGYGGGPPGYGVSMAGPGPYGGPNAMGMGSPMPMPPMYAGQGYSVGGPGMYAPPPPPTYDSGNGVNGAANGIPQHPSQGELPPPPPYQ